MANSLNDRLRAALAGFDGHATTILGEAEAAFGGEAGYLCALIDLAGDGDGNLAIGATWLIKAALESGNTLDATEIAALVVQLPRVTAWPAQLHLCQSIQYLQISGDDAGQLVDWLSPLLAHPRPFLRAWSLDALARVSQTGPDFADRFANALAKAERDDAASVRARARNLRGAL